MLSAFFQPRQQKFLREQAHHLYDLTVKQMQTPFFYQHQEIPDDPRGRFEVLSLHLFIMLRALKEKQHQIAEDLSQLICNFFVEDMDHSLRNLSLSESKIDKTFKKFVEGFYGRLVAYDAAYEADRDNLSSNFENQPTKLVESFLKNIYNNDKVKSLNAQWFAHYVVDQLTFMKTFSFDTLCFKKDLYHDLF